MTIIENIIMKATTLQYAKALYEATKDKDQKEIDRVLADFVKVLSKNNQIRLAGNVSKKFQDIYNSEHGIVEAEVVSYEKLNSLLVDKLNSYIKEKYKAKDVVINNIVDKSIKGGVIVKVGDEVMDGSVTRQLAELKKSLNH
jgi:F-type H+-transporting ATPase subunit delta